MDETALILSAKKGDLDAFNRLVLFYQDSAFNLACHLLGDDDLASDATQASFISAYRNLASFRGGSFKAWLFRIVSNNCMDEIRRQKRHPKVPLEPVNADSEEEFETPTWLEDSHTPSPEVQLEMKELEQGIQHCLNSLPQEFKLVVLLVEIEGMDYQEVSQAIQKPLGTVKSRLARARSKLQECLRGYRELLPDQFRLGEEESL